MRDPFGDDRAAGAINGTKPLIGDGVVVVVDTNNKFSNANGVAVFATGAAVNDGRWWAQQTRIDGRCFIVTVIPSNTSGIINIGWDANQSGVITDAIQFAAAGVINIIPNGGAVVPVGVYTATSYRVCIKLLALGFVAFIRGGAFTNWTRLFQTAAGTGNAFPAIGVGSATSVFTADDAKVIAREINSQPEAGDGFSIQAVTDGLVANNLGGAGLTWTGATWTVAGGAVSNTPGVGAELLTDGGLEDWASATDLTSWTESLTGTSTVNREATVIHGGTYSARLDVDASNSACRIQQGIATAGRWYTVSVFARSDSGTPQIGIADESGAGHRYLPLINSTYTNYLCTLRMSAASSFITMGRISAPSRSIYLDDATTKQLTLSTLFRSLVVSTPDVYHKVKVSALTTGTQVGGVIRLDSAATPTQGIIFYFDGNGKIACEEFTGTTTYTELFTAVVKAFTANDSLIIWAQGTAIRIYHETSAGVQTLIGTGTTTVSTGNIHGLFSTYSENTIVALATYPVGTEGQHEGLNNL